MTFIYVLQPEICGGPGGGHDGVPQAAEVLQPPNPGALSRRDRQASLVNA